MTAIVIGLLWIGFGAQAAVTVTPVNVTARVGTNVSGISIHVGAIYPTTVNSITGGAIDPSLSLVDLSKSWTAEADGSRGSMMVFDVASDVSFAPGVNDRVGLVIEARGSTGTLIPIAAVGAVGTPTAALPSCGTVSGACYAPSGSNYLAAPYTPGGVVRVGFYPRDVCLQGSANSPDGCSGSSVAAIPTTMRLTFRIRTTAQNTAERIATEDSSAEIPITFHSEAPTSCACTLRTLYVPGDSSIFLNCAAVTGGTSSAGAPLHSIVFVASKNGTPVTTDSGWRGNAIVGTPELNCQNGGSIGGFENATAPGYTSPSYGAALTVRDEAGLIRSFASCTTCTPTPDVTTRDIRGFLGSSNCFVSSSALGPDSWATDQFRGVRDRWLVKYPWTRTWVDAYYRWSPGAAAWLEARPWAKWVVGVALWPFASVAGVLNWSAS